jgi:hypothetical protein
MNSVAIAAKEVFELQRANPEQGATRMRAAEPPSRFLT